MSIKRKCIFHFPNPLNENGTSGSSIRPVKMLNALRNIGYEVDIISGYSNEREQNIKNNWKEGDNNTGKNYQP